MVLRRLQRMPRSLIIGFWHYSVLEMFKYIGFEKL